jgi:hypothetical protein
MTLSPPTGIELLSRDTGAPLHQNIAASRYSNIKVSQLLFDTLFGMDLLTLAGTASSVRV